MHMKTSSKYVFLTYYIYFSSFLPFILLISWYRWRSCAKCALSQRIAHFFLLFLSLFPLFISPTQMPVTQVLPLGIHRLNNPLASKVQWLTIRYNIRTEKRFKVRRSCDLWAKKSFFRVFHSDTHSNACNIGSTARNSSIEQPIGI